MEYVAPVRSGKFWPQPCTTVVVKDAWSRVWLHSRTILLAVYQLCRGWGVAAWWGVGGVGGEWVGRGHQQLWQSGAAWALRTAGGAECPDSQAAAAAAERAGAAP